MTANRGGVVRVYVSHSDSKEDLSLVAELLLHLRGLVVGGKLRVQTSSTPRTEEDVVAGTVSALTEADLVLVALSPHALDSNWMLGFELPKARELREQGCLLVAPLRLREVTGVHLRIPWLAGIVGFPKSGAWVGAKRQRDGVWPKVAMEIDEICESILARRSSETALRGPH